MGRRTMCDDRIVVASGYPTHIPFKNGFCWWQVNYPLNNIPSIQSLWSHGSLQIYAHNLFLNYNEIILPRWPSFILIFLWVTPSVHLRSVCNTPYRLHRSFKTGVPCVIPTWTVEVISFFFLGGTSPSIWSSSECTASTLALDEETFQADILF